MSNITKSCIFPLVNTEHEPFISGEEASCGISCQDPLEFFVYFTSSERSRLKEIVFIISVTTVLFAPFYFCLVLSEIQIKRDFLSISFSWQCPFFISCGYLLVACITICPYVFGFAPIICNDEEESLTWNSYHNVWCSVTAIGVYIGIRLTVFYTCALSVSLVLTLYFPKYKQMNLCYHSVIWVCIFIGLIPIFYWRSISGDYNLGFCTTTLSSRNNLLWLDIIPLSSCVSVFCVCLAMAAIKLYRQQDDDLAKLLAVNAHMRSLFHRLLAYNFLQTTSVTASIGNFCYWYTNLDIWKETALSLVSCQIHKTMMEQTSLEDYELCLTDNEDLPHPGIFSYWFFHLCALVSVIGAIVFECSLKMQRVSMSEAKKLVLAISNTQSIRRVSGHTSDEFLEEERDKVKPMGSKQTELVVLPIPKGGSKVCLPDIKDMERNYSCLTETTTLSRLSSGPADTIRKEITI